MEWAVPATASCSTPNKDRLYIYIHDASNQGLSSPTAVAAAAESESHGDGGGGDYDGGGGGDGTGDRYQWSLVIAPKDESRPGASGSRFYAKRIRMADGSVRYTFAREDQPLVLYHQQRSQSQYQHRHSQYSSSASISTATTVMATVTGLARDERWPMLEVDPEPIPVARVLLAKIELPMRLAEILSRVPVVGNENGVDGGTSQGWVRDAWAAVMQEVRDQGDEGVPLLRSSTLLSGLWDWLGIRNEVIRFVYAVVDRGGAGTGGACGLGGLAGGRLPTYDLVKGREVVG